MGNPTSRNDEDFKDDWGGRSVRAERGPLTAAVLDGCGLAAAGAFVLFVAAAILSCFVERW